MRLLRYFATYYSGVILLALIGLNIIMVAVVLIENAGNLSRIEGFNVLFTILNLWMNRSSIVTVSLIVR